MVLDLYKLPQTVFTVKELTMLFPHIPPGHMRRRIHYYTQTGHLLHVRTGVYAKPGYEPFELANKIYAPSYISFETVLLREGIIFQPYTTIYLASSVSRTITVANQTIRYRKMRNDLLYTTEGIRVERGYFIASKERAFLDTVLLDKDRHFDHLDVLDWKEVFRLMGIYRNASLEKRVRSYAESHDA